METDPTDVPRVRNALRRFLSTQLQPGFKLSIGGRAFTASAPKPLLQILCCCRPEAGRARVTPGAGVESPGVKGFVPLMPRDAGGEPVTRHPPVLRASLPGARREGWN
jgi:hypothetical protein